MSETTVFRIFMLFVVLIFAGFIAALGTADNVNEYREGNCIVKVHEYRSWFQTIHTSVTRYCKEKS